MLIINSFLMIKFKMKNSFATTEVEIFDDNGRLTTLVKVPVAQLDSAAPS